MEVKKKRGGARPGAGRKTKADENRIRTLSINALTKIFNSEEQAIEHLANEASKGGKDGLPYFKLLLEYAYGKPKETIDLNNKIIEVSFTD